MTTSLFQLAAWAWFVVESILFHAKTLYLFTSADIVTSLLPIVSTSLIFTLAYDY